MPVQANITVWVGNDIQIEFQMQAPDGAVRNVTGSTFVLRMVGAGGVEALRLTQGSGLTVPDPTNGLLYADITRQQSRSLPAAGSVVRYELEERLSSGRQITRAFGDVVRISWANDDI